MSNGLLLGLLEYWEPSVSLGSLKGMVAGIDFTIPGNPIVSFPSFPSGKAIEVSFGSDVLIFTTEDPLIQGFGETDFLAMLWGQHNASATGTARYNSMVFGENGSNGFDMQAYNPDAREVSGGMPYADTSYSPIIDEDLAFPLGSPYCILLWWIASELTLRMQVNAGTVFSVTSLIGVGPPDPADRGIVVVGGAPEGPTYSGDHAIWRGNEGVANALSQRALLFGGLPLSQFDNGGGGPGTEDCRASAIMVSLPWRGMYPQPDGTIGLGDRIQTAFMYRCIADPPPSGNNNEVFFVGGTHPGLGGHHSICRI